MADDTTTPLPSGRPEGPGRGNRQGGARDAGGFRIRLSDNEMQAARALQEAFGLRSTVAVLGFALRTLAQQLEQGQLEELVAQHRAQAGSRPGGPREGGERRRERSEGRDGGRGPAPRAARVDPFARPSRPAPAVPPPDADGEHPLADEPAAASDADGGSDLSAVSGEEATAPVAADAAADDSAAAGVLPVADEA